MGNTLETQILSASSVEQKRLGKGLDLQGKRFQIHNDHYTFQKELGEGGFGAVWKAVTDSGQKSAVKVIDINKARAEGEDGMFWINSFDKEVKMAFRMRQATKHVVKIFGFDFDPKLGLGLMAMELGGDTLEKRIEKLHAQMIHKDLHYHPKHVAPHSHHHRHHHHSQHQHPHVQKAHGTKQYEDYIPATSRKNIWHQLVKILEALKKYDVIHRDLKPANLIFFGPLMKVVDLGIAQKSIMGIDQDVSGAGTFCYSAPECFKLNHVIDARADLWSAGIILYEMTYGEIPCADNGELRSGLQPTRAPPTRSRYVQDVLHHLLRKDPRHRPDHRWLKHHPLTSRPDAF